MSNRRFIEESFPVKEVSVESAKEKNIRHGHISTLHIWWARRPLASSRATSYAALIPAPKSIDEWNKKREFIINFSKWENSLNQSMIEQARKDILAANGGKPPKVLDPFGGGGAIPLEALRLGCEVYSNDLNPVAVLIQKCTLEYPQKYGKPGEVEREVEEFGKKVKKKIKVNNVLLEDVRYWGNWVLEEAKKEIGKFYPPDPDGSIPVGYIWARTIPCQNPACDAEIPLMRQFWLAKKDKKKVALYPYVTASGAKQSQRSVHFKIVGDGYEKMPKDFDPEKGTISKAIVNCPVCSTIIDDDTTRKQFQEKRDGQRLLTAVLNKSNQNGKHYRLATEEDVQTFQDAERYLEQKRKSLITEWGIDPVPDEPIHTPDGKEYSPGNLLYNFTPVLLYGMTKWRDLFNSRQKLAMIIFTEKVRKAYREILKNRMDDDYAKAIVCYLTLGIDRTLMFMATLTRWKPDAECPVDVFGRQALPMTWDYAENNPIFPHSGAFIDQIERILYSLEQTFVFAAPATLSQSSAISLSYPDNYFDAIFTDPPYYDNVPYATLSDFFYVWLKRSIGDLLPDLFSTPLTPKLNEAIAELPLLRGMGKEKASLAFKHIKTKEHFEEMLKSAFKEIFRVLRPKGVAVIVYAHKSTEGWETLINSLLDSNLIVTGAYPLHTEMQARLRASESAALASSIYIVARKMERQPTGFYNEVKEELKKHLNKKLERLWQEGIGGADFFISAIGSAIEVFGKYEKVMDYEGNIIRADRLLEDVRKIATDYAVHQILHNGFAGEISDLTRFYVLYRWDFGEAKVHFDEARKLAQSCGIDLAAEWNRDGFIKKEKEFIRALGPQERRFEDLKGSTELIDVLHNVLLLWEKSKRDDMLKLLDETGYGESEAFYRVAQAVSETLPNESKEKKLLDGFLAGRERVREEVRKTSEGGRLF